MTSQALHLPANIDAAKAKLPVTYEGAKKALEQCQQIDECKDWADKAAALASYARQASDDQLEQMAARIRARAWRRAGELLKQIEPGQGARDGKRVDGADSPLTRTETARQAGMSERQHVTAIRVANVPDREFERMVEREKPATVTAVAEAGRQLRPVPVRMALQPSAVTPSMLVENYVVAFAKWCSENPAEPMAAGVADADADRVRQVVEKIDRWLDRFMVNLPQSS